MFRSRRRRFVVIGDEGTAPLAVAADRLDWKLAGVADAPAIAGALRSKDRSVEDITRRADAEVALVGSPVDRRAADVDALRSAGLHVVVVPSADVELGSTVEPAALLSLGDPFPTAPAVQRWFARLRELDDVANLTGRLRLGQPAELGQIWSLVAGCVLSGRLRGWTSDRRIEVTAWRSATNTSVITAQLQLGSATIELVIETQHDAGTPLLELQASGRSDALRVEMFPTPHVEHNGAPVALPPARHPADAFGATDLLANFAADIDRQRRPVLGARFHDEIAPLVAGLHVS